MNIEFNHQFRKEFSVVAIILLIKLLIIFLLPLTGDEAYFVRWGTHLAQGYYDHPPMVGWLIYLMSFVSENISFYRLFSFFTGIIIAYFLYLFSKNTVGNTKATYIGLLILASPIDILMTLFTNDIPLVLFGTVGAYLFYSAFTKGDKQKIIYASLAGVFFGLSFLSKYFVVILIFALFVYALFYERKKAFLVISIAIVFMLPFIFQNLYYNYNHCWNNIIFNFFTRPKTEYRLTTILGFLGTIVYLITPWGLWMLKKLQIQKSSLIFLILTILSTVFVLFLYVSLKNNIGLHWFLLFMPYLFLLFAFLPLETLKKFFNYNSFFTLAHGIIILIILLLPLSLFEKHRSYSSIVYAVKPDAICREIKPYDDKQLFALGYTPAAIISYGCHRDIRMLFNRSKYGRLDDRLTDVTSLDHKNIFIFHPHKIDRDKLLKACDNVTIKVLNAEKAKFYLAECDNFSYTRYRDAILNDIEQEYYTIPKWLPVGQCYFKKMYEYR